MELSYTNILAGNADGFAFRLLRLVSYPIFVCCHCWIYV